MRVQAQYLYDQGVRKIGILLAEHPYLEEASQALQRNLVPGQTLVVIDELPRDQVDLRTNILRLTRRKDEFDVLGVFLFAGQISTFYRQARELQFNRPTFGTDFFESLSEIRTSKGTMNGLMFTSINIKAAFLKKYKELFHNESQLAFGAPAYEFAITVGELFNKRGGALTADEIIQGFSTVTSKDGVASGPYGYVNDAKAGQYFRFPISVKRIVGEGFEVVR